MLVINFFVTKYIWFSFLKVTFTSSLAFILNFSYFFLYFSGISSYLYDFLSFFLEDKSFLSSSILFSVNDSCVSLVSSISAISLNFDDEIILTNIF